MCVHGARGALERAADKLGEAPGGDVCSGSQRITVNGSPIPQVPQPKTQAAASSPLSAPKSALQLYSFAQVAQLHPLLSVPTASAL